MSAAVTSSPAGSPGLLADTFFKQELARQRQSKKRRVLLLILAVVGFIVLFALLYSSWGPLINSSATGYGFEIALTAQYSFMNGVIWNTGWNKTGEFLATLYYNCAFGGATDPIYSPGNNACGSSCSGTGQVNSFDEWVGSKSDLANAGQDCTPSSSCSSKMTIISLIKANASSASTIAMMFSTAQNWSVINNDPSKPSNGSGVVNDIFAYGLPVLNTLLMGGALIV